MVGSHFLFLSPLYHHTAANARIFATARLRALSPSHIRAGAARRRASLYTRLHSDRRYDALYAWRHLLSHQTLPQDKGCAGMARGRAQKACLMAEASNASLPCAGRLHLGWTRAAPREVTDIISAASPSPSAFHLLISAPLDGTCCALLLRRAPRRRISLQHRIAHSCLLTLLHTLRIAFICARFAALSTKRFGTARAHRASLRTAPLFRAAQQAPLTWQIWWGEGHLLPRSSQAALRAVRRF